MTFFYSKAHQTIEYLLRTAPSAFSFLLAIEVFSVITSSRLASITGITQLSTLQNYFYFFVSLYSSILLIKYNSKYFFYIATIFSVIMMHSYFNTYQPSLRYGVPRVDYLLHDKISAHYTFGRAYAYMKMVVLFLPPSLVFAKLYTNKKLNLTWVYSSLAGALILTIAASLLQYGINNEILSINSGSAIGAKRMPGLLEDGGASAVFYTLSTGALFATLTLNSLKSLKLNTFLLLLALGSSAAGIASNGRVFYFGTFLTLAILIILKATPHAARHKVRFTLLALSFSSIFPLGYKYNFFPRRVTKALEAIGSQDLSTLLFHPIDTLYYIDKVRFGHQLTMWLAFQDKPFFGHGLGWFYANYYHYFPVIQKTNIPFYPDPPSSFYLMILSELGIIGFLLLLPALIAVFLSIKTIFKKKELPLFNYIATAIALSLLISWIIGIHIIFHSIAFFSILAFSYLIYYYSKSLLWFKKLSLTLSLFTIVGLASNSLFLLYTAPRVPEFRWAERNKPQMPISPNPPIATPKNGYWLIENIEYIYRGHNIKLFIEMPPNKYPQTTKISIYNSKGILLEEFSNRIEKYHTPTPGKIIIFKPSDTTKQHCTKKTAHNYCYLKFQSNPVWLWNSQPLSGYYVN